MPHGVVDKLLGWQLARSVIILGSAETRVPVDSSTDQFGDKAGQFGERLGRFGNRIGRFVDNFTNSVTDGSDAME